MHIPRRSLLKGAAAGALASAIPAAASPGATGTLPVVGQFVVDRYEVCLNNARWHPLSNGARRAVTEYLDYKARGVWVPPPNLASPESIAVRQSFADLIGASPAEIAFVNSTTAGENLVLAALGLTQGGPHNIVTDALHFEGSLYLYTELRKRGVDVRIVKPRGWQIESADLEAAVDRHTRLIAISAVSFINGFAHDLKAVADLAHSHGALVYVDAVQAAGCVPLDVRATGIDFLAAASYKWLMGDFGLGFLFARKEILPKLQPTQWSYRQVTDFEYHAFPGDSPGPFPASYNKREDAAGLFELGTYANGVLAALQYSLPWIGSLGVAEIQKHALSLNGKLRAEMPRLGYQCITPEQSRGPIIAFAVRDNSSTAAKLRTRKIDVGLSAGRMRISPSVYNTAADADALLAALS